MTAKIYEETVLKPVVKPLNNSLFKRQLWIFQQDSAPAHKSKRSQEWFANNVPAFIRAEEWTSSSQIEILLLWIMGHFGIECILKTLSLFEIA